MQSIIGSTMLGIGTILVSSMFAVLKSLEHVHPIIRASWRLQATALALAPPCALSIYLAAATTLPNNRDHNNNKGNRSSRKTSTLIPPMDTVWSGIGYAMYNVGLCTALAKTSLLRASILSQCAPLFIVLYNYSLHKIYPRRGERRGRGVHLNHILGVFLTLVGTAIYINSTTPATTSDDVDADATIINPVTTNNLRYIGQEEISVSALSPLPAIVVATSYVNIEEERSHSYYYDNNIIGDINALFASAGYAIYISCGRKARKIVPVYIHLPGCVFVALILVSTFCLITVVHDVVDVDQTTTAHHHYDDADYNDAFNNRKDTILNEEEEEEEEEESNELLFCGNLFGWMCQQYLPRVAFLGIVCGAIAVSLINCSLTHVSALQAAAANSAEPITASIIGIMFFFEPIPNFTAITAAGIIVIAMMLCSTDDSDADNNANNNSKKWEDSKKLESSSRAREFIA
jgi:drug/metabolite transporter (DMT)-like permease